MRRASASTINKTAGAIATAPTKLVAKNERTKKLHALDRIGIDGRPIRRHDADGEREPCGHAGHDQGEDNDDDPGEQ